MALIHEGLAVDGLTIMARHQLAGRGQRGRQWHGEPGQSLMMSLILRPFPVNLSRQFLFSASVALGLLEVCQSFQADGWAIKWPNDLYWNDRKAAGILIENSIQGRKWNWAVVGIGLNLNQTEFPAGLVHAVSVRQVTGMEYSPKEVAGSLAYSIRKHLDMIKTDADTIIEAYNRNLYKSGKAALLSKQGRSFEARILGPHRGQARERHAIGFLGREARTVADADRRRSRFRRRLVFRLAAHAPAQHRIELVEHNGREACKDDQFEDLQRGTLVSTGSSKPI